MNETYWEIDLYHVQLSSRISNTFDYDKYKKSQH